MRTTVTLDPDTHALVHKLMRERGLTFKQAVNDAIRAGVNSGGRRADPTIPRAMGLPRVDLTKALRLAGELEDEEIVRKLAQGR